MTQIFIWSSMIKNSKWTSKRSVKNQQSKKFKIIKINKIYKIFTILRKNRNEKGINNIYQEDKKNTITVSTVIKGIIGRQY